jgi:hypothetical protein
MDTKMQALAKAQELQRQELLKTNKVVDLFHRSEEHRFDVWIDDELSSEFKYSELKPLAHDTLVHDASSGMYLYACGEIMDSKHVFYPPGYCSKNINRNGVYWVGGKAILLEEGTFEIIEKPAELDRIPSCGPICANVGCIFESSDKCKNCTFLIGKPTEMKEEE